MVKIDSDSTAVAKAIRKLIATLERHGAHFNKSLAIICRDGDLSIQTVGRIKSQQVILGLPTECLLPVEDFKLSLSGDAVEICNYNPSVTPARLKIMELMIEVFNLTNKISQYRDSTLSSLRREHPKVYMKLCSGRIKETELPPQRASQNDPVIDDLIETRALVYRLDPSSNRHSLVLMPVMDYCNHHPFAQPFAPAINPKGRRMLTTRGYCPDSDARECFVRYGLYDSYDCFLHYGFVDKLTPFVISIPMEIKLPAPLGKMIIQARPSQSSNQLPKQFIAHVGKEQIEEIRLYFPSYNIDREGKLIKLSHLMIPQDDSSNTLQLIIEVILQQIEPRLTEQELLTIVEMIEQHVLSVNVDFYNGLARYLSDITLSEQFAALHMAAKEVVDLQLDKLQL